MAKMVELVGGPRGEQFVSIPEADTDFLVTAPDMELMHKQILDPNTKEEDLIPVKHGRYTQRYTGSHVFDWQGWDS